jgi:chromosome segregation protein
MPRRWRSRRRTPWPKRAVAERYARLHVARILLRSGIDRFRREQQEPLLRGAGRHFALLTGGRYERLAVDYDPAGRAVLLAIRDTGTECPVEALSEGARDQLYLALRIATIEAYAAQTEPLPFTTDDLLVHFDDVRAASAIALLAELGQTTQVILFTITITSLRWLRSKPVSAYRTCRV